MWREKSKREEALSVVISFLARHQCQQGADGSSMTSLLSVMAAKDAIFISSGVLIQYTVFTE